MLVSVDDGGGDIDIDVLFTVIVGAEVELAVLVVVVDEEVIKVLNSDGK